MNRMSIWASLLLIVAGSVRADSIKPAIVLPEEYKLAWADEFDYPDAQLDKNWESQNGPSGHILCSRWRENVLVSEGTLKLMNRKEKRGGQEWTSGSIWTNNRFKYGYFECRYRYAAAEGTNNSFWIMMSPKDQPVNGKRFEIDINEGHMPNEVATNIHNWTDVKEVNGKKTHPSASKHFVFGQRPDVRVQLETPVKTTKVRLVSNNPTHFHLREFRIYGVSNSGYPAVLLEPKGNGVENFARDAKTKISVSGFHTTVGPESVKNLVDGKIDTSWISQPDGEKSVTFEFDGEKTIGCIQFINGWKTDGHWTSARDWQGLIKQYQVQYWNGTAWVDMSSYDQKDSEVNFARDFHTLGLLWTKEELVFYHDGKEIRRARNDFCFDPAPVWLSEAIISWAGKVTDAIDKTQMEVDYVRVYQKPGDEIVPGSK